MTDHTGLPVKGYGPQSAEKVALVNKNKELEEAILRLMDGLRGDAFVGQIDGRWLAIARTHIEEGFMAFNRSIFQPQRIKLDGDEGE